MSYTIGFDLGTHQTKICIQDASNPLEKTYEFLSFTTPDGGKTFMLPSLVQINKDHTVSYGFADEEDCLEIVHSDVGPKPELNLLTLPELNQYIKQPTTDFDEYDPISYTTEDLVNEREKANKKASTWIHNKNESDDDEIEYWYENAEIDLRRFAQDMSRTCKENNNRRAQYIFNLAKWEFKNTPSRCRFRYFKQAAIVDNHLWQNKDFSSKEIAVWYICYILKLIQERGYEDYAINFGVPCGATNSEKDRELTFRCFSLFIAAADLADKYNSLEDYLAATYEELRENTEFKTLNKKEIDNYYFDDIPEAFAGLVSVTSQRKLGMGFHMLIDIGGGTTDMAIFTVSKDLSPNVHAVASFPYGLNYILELAQNESGKKISALQREFQTNCLEEIFEQPTYQYRQKLTTEGNKIIQQIVKAFWESYGHHGLKLSNLNKALNWQPILFCGGGSIYSNVRTPIGLFQDIMQFNKNLLDIKNLLNEREIGESLYPILAVSYGLANYEKDINKGIRCVDISKVFQTFLPNIKEDSGAHDKFEHGLSDFD